MAEVTANGVPERSASLSGQTILVSGGAGKIGSAIVRAIVSRGGNAVIGDVNTNAATALQKELPSEQVLFAEANLTDPDQVDRVLEAGHLRFGALTGAVHAAYPRSAEWGTRFESLTRDALTEDLSTQLGGTILFAQRVVAALRGTGGGSIVLLSSIQGLSAPKFRHYQGTEMNSPIEYSAIKAGVNAVARYLAKYLTNEQIRVNVVSPGGIEAGQPESFLTKYREECTNKGMLGADDITGAVCFLLSGDARYINGQNIVVDDGWSL